LADTRESLEQRRKVLLEAAQRRHLANNNNNIGQPMPQMAYAVADDVANAPPLLLRDRCSNIPQLPTFDPPSRLTIGGISRPAMPTPWPKSSSEVLFDHASLSPTEMVEERQLLGTPLFDTSLAGPGTIRVLNGNGSGRSSPRSNATDLLDNRHSMEWPTTDEDPLTLNRELVAAGIGSPDGPPEEFPAVPLIDPNDPRLRQH